MLGDQRDGGDAGKLVDQMAHRLDLLRRAAVHREQHRVHRALADHPDGVRTESRCTTAKHPFPAASTRSRSPGSSTAATVVDGRSAVAGTGILQAMVQEDELRTSIRVQPETS